MRSSIGFCKTAQTMVLAFSLIFSAHPVFAHSGCCSRHGGVAGCNSSTDRQLCKDGTTSPTCACEAGNNMMTTPANKTTTRRMHTNQATPSAAEGTTAAAATTTTSKASKKKQKGCCARHGGVRGCNKSTGHSICKDGTESAACTC